MKRTHQVCCVGRAPGNHGCVGAGGEWTSACPERAADGSRRDHGVRARDARGVHLTFEEGPQAQWLHDLLAPYVHRVVVCDRASLAHPHQSRDVTS
jgi:hypothetical protein